MIYNWQSEIHPYPTLVKVMDQLDDEPVKLSTLFEARRRTPPQLKRCVLSVAKKHDGDTSKAFAICTSSLQGKGYLKVGSQEPTKKGATAGRSKAADKTHGDKLSAYERLLKMAKDRRKEEADQ